MKNSNRFSVAAVRILLGAGVVASGVLAAALPVYAQSATYAYVNQQGEVRTVMADNPNMALATAPNIDEHSGVILLVSQADYTVVGTNVGGM